MHITPIDAILQAYARGPAHPCKVRCFQMLLRLLKGPNAIMRLRVGGGLEFYIDPNDHMGRGLLFRGWHEELTTTLLLENVLPSDIVCVAGVHIGYHVIHLARRVTGGCIIGFEPAPQTMAKALANVQLNQVQNRVKLMCHGLGDTCAYIPMPEPPPSSTGAAHFRKPNAEGSGYIAYIDRLDLSMARLNVDQLDVLLLDVEGFEWLALKGLGQFRPRLIVIETDPRFHDQMGESQLDFFDYVRGLGYELHAVTGEPVKGGGWFPEGNVVAVRHGSPPVHWASIELFRKKFSN